MKLVHYCFYNRETGLFHQRTISCASERLAALNTPARHMYIAGEFDPLSQRFDIETAQVVDYQPPQPSEDHEWNADSRRWVLKREVLQRQAEKASARARILELEAKAHRYQRTATLGDEEGKQRLAQVEAEIDTLRPLAFPKE